ncbi:MAG: family 20 glycosylhydrolase [Clostridia bacterium]
MLNQAQQRIAQRILAGIPQGQQLAFTCTQGDGLNVQMKDGHAEICCDSKSAFARGVFLAAQAVKHGKNELSLHQTRHFEACGPMLDMSRGGVMTVASVKKTIDAMAALGLNLLMLYTEDTYEVPEYPYMGYLRGRYTQAELRELDDYADEMGVELVPCIQTLAHLEQFLQWQVAAELRDTNECLMIDDAETYRFIEAEIKAIRACFRSKRAHIGMDEAHGVGLGRYLEKHGIQDRFELLNRHLTRVVELCQKYDFKPIMWSDMFFRLGSKTNDYYDVTAIVPDEAIARIPDVALCYWDYYHQEEAFYDEMIRRHMAMGKELVFAGGIWTWAGQLPHEKRSLATMEPAMRACLKNNVGMVLATMWEDDGCETDHLSALSDLPIFSEYCWLGEACTRKDIEKMGEWLTNLPRAVYHAMGELFPTAEDIRPGKGYLYCDPLYNLAYGICDMPAYGASLTAARELLQAHLDQADCAFADLLFEIVLAKMKLLSTLRDRYLKQDRAYLEQTAKETLPHLVSLYKRLMQLHRARWEAHYKRNGWETLCLRYGGAMARLEDAADELKRYLNGELVKIAELEEEPLPYLRKGGEQYRVFADPKA